MDLGSAYRRTGRKEDAAAAYRQALELGEKEIARAPRDGPLRVRLAYLCAQLGDRQRAESELGQALRDSAEDTVALAGAVQVYEVLGQRENAFAVLAALPDEVLLDISHEPDLADLSRNSRFQELLDRHHLK
jgi:Flp pilus assembly protein TadD